MLIYLVEEEFTGFNHELKIRMLQLQDSLQLLLLLLTERPLILQVNRKMSTPQVNQSSLHSILFTEVFFKARSHSEIMTATAIDASNMFLCSLWGVHMVLQQK